MKLQIKNMKRISENLKKKIASPDPLIREQAAQELGRHPGPEALGFHTRMLSDGNRAVVYRATQSIVATGGVEAVDQMIPLLESEDVRLRNLAIEIIARIGDPALTRVTALLTDPDPDIRKFAVDILQKINSPDTQEPLVRALFDEDPNVAACAAEALGGIGAQTVVRHLVSSMEREPWVKCAAIRSLGRIGGDAALKAVLSVSPDEESMILFCVVTALGAMGDPKGLDYLMGLLETDASAVELPAIQAIESILAGADEDLVGSVRKRIAGARLIGLLETGHRAVTRSAIRLLGIFREKSAVEALARLYTEGNKHLFEDLNNAILQINPEQIDPLLEILANEMNPDSVKISVIRVIGRLNPKTAYPALEACLKKGRDKLAVETIRALSGLKDDRTAALLHDLLEDADDEIRIAAIKGLETFCHPSSIERLMRLSREDSEAVRSAAAKSLRTYDQSAHRHHVLELMREKRPESISFALEMLPEGDLAAFETDIVKLCEHENKTVRRHAIVRAGRLNSARSVERVTRAVFDQDLQVRRAAIRALETYHGPDLCRLLLKAAESDSDEWNRYEAVKSIGRLQLRDCLAPLVDLLDAVPDLVKAAIMDLIAAFGAGEHRKTVGAYLQSRESVLQEAAEEALRRLAIDAES